MNYQEQLNELKKSDMRDDVEIKFVPGKHEDGWLSDDTRTELQNMFAHNPMFQNMDHKQDKPAKAPKISIQAFRDGMGAKHKNVAKHELIIDNTILNGSVTCRTYVREDLKDQVLPAMIYVHGGAFYGGSMMAVDDIARAFADFGPYRVFNLEYSLAPEHPFPTALLECYNNLKYLHDHATMLKLDPNKFYMSGDSAGGNLTATTAYLDHVIFKTNFLTRIVLYYPDVTEVRDQKKELADTSSYTFKEMGKELTAMADFFSSDELAGNLYRNGHAPEEHLISILNVDHLEEMPPTEVIVGEFDPLRGQGEAFNKKLRDSNVETHYIRYNGMSHAFLDSLGYYPQAEDSIEEAVKFLNK